MSKVLRVVVLLIVALVVFIMTRPSQFHIERSTTIAAPPEVVYAKIVDFHQWEEWSPWEHLDPNMKRTIDGPESGVGAKYQWSGNDKAGEGSMTIVEAQPNERVKIDLEFIKPFKASNVATFMLAPEGQGTKVVWSLDGRNNFMAKAFSVFMNMDKMVGGDFEKGLASLKNVSEEASAGSVAPVDSTASTTTTR